MTTINHTPCEWCKGLVVVCPSRLPCFSEVNSYFPGKHLAARSVERPLTERRRVNGVPASRLCILPVLAPAQRGLDILRCTTDSDKLGAGVPLGTPGRPLRPLPGVSRP